MSTNNTRNERGQYAGKAPKNHTTPETTRGRNVQSHSDRNARRRATAEEKRQREIRDIAEIATLMNKVAENESLAELTSVDELAASRHRTINEYDIENLSPQTLLTLAPYAGIWDLLTPSQISSIIDTTSGLTLNGQAFMSSNLGRSSYRTPKASKNFILPNGDKHYL